MKTSHRISRPILSQTENNTTLWIGHLTNDTNDRLAGQTFSCPSDGLLDNIQVYSSAVTQPGEVVLTLHEFDPETKSWGPAIAESRHNIEKVDALHWIRFDLEPVGLQKDRHYGFRLQTEQGIIGIGEAVSHAQRPFPFGQAWSSDTGRAGERFFSYFSLAFKVEMCA
ncbi:MAG: hypothetical protein ACO25B_10035 [Chitinophagaceae bacterium]